MERVWYRFLQPSAVLSEHAAVDALAEAGLRLHPFERDPLLAPGILFFDQSCEYLYETLGELSVHGLRKVLAVAISAPAMAGDGAWRLLQAGASDVLAWDRSKERSREIAQRLERWGAIERIIISPLVKENLVGGCAAWIRVGRQVVEIGKFTDAAVLVAGESGTGKELVARLIHTLDSRPNKRDLVVLDCTTIVPELSGSEFFGHERGAFTGAVTSRDGAFALANGGTLFLDEIGDLPPGLQAQLLRVVQEHTYKRVGGNEWHETNFRLVCATNRDLAQEVNQGRFRSDLYYRIATCTCKLPPLRERIEDILPLARHFIQQLSPEGYTAEVSNEVREYLLRREYPGNVRDLKQMISRVLCRHVGSGPITVGDIPEDERPSVPPEREHWYDAHFEQAIRRALSLGAGLKEIGGAAEATAVRITIAEENGNLRRAAQKLGVTRRALEMRRATGRDQQ